MFQGARRVAFAASILALLAMAGPTAWATEEPPPVDAPGPVPSPVSDAPGCDGRLEGERLHWIISARPGANYDVLARIIAPHFGALLGAESVFDNRPGSSGLVGYKATQSAVAEGKLVVNVLSGGQTLIGSAHGRLPDPATGMYVLGHVAGSQYVLATGKESPFRTLDDVLAAKGPLVIAVYEPTGSSFLRVVGVAELLGLDVRFVTGYKSSPQLAMAALRGEVDLILIGFEAQEALFESGDLRALLDFTGEIEHPAVKGVPVLVGPDGAAMARARALGRDLDETRADVAGLLALSTIGRIVSVPDGTDPTLVPCLRATLAATFELPDFRRELAATSRETQTETADGTLARIERARARLDRFKRSADDAAVRLSQ